MPKKRFFYVYCVTSAAPAGIRTEIGNNVCLIRQNGLCAVVGSVSPEEFAEENIKKSIADTRWLESNVLLHERVIETAMKSVPAVVPFKFATVFKTAGGIKAMLKERSSELNKTLKKLADKEEWGVKIYCSPDPIQAYITKKCKKIKTVEREIRTLPAGRAYFLKKKKDGLIEDALGRMIIGCTQEGFRRLGELSRDARISRLLPKEITGRKDEMVLNASFLVERTKLEGFLECADRLKERLSVKGFTLVCTGPWPPYNFCMTEESAR